jgi:putative protease
VDAVIVQDVGLCRLIRELSPDFPIHASTQMTITSAAGVEFARDLGCQLVVLARELSIKDIEQIRSAFPASRSALPLEVFVHGALCVAYSGQCLTSEALGGRSANRGECAQACRMPYDLFSDGKQVPLGDRRYLLSPQDLAGVDLLPELARVGVASLKIEGRLKSPEYVANITRIYRQALDELGARTAAFAGQVTERKTTRLTGAVPHSAFRTPRYEMEMAFSRGLHTGWFEGINNQQLVHARFGKKRGVFLGEVTHVGRDHVEIRLEGPLKPGDGVVFDAGRPELPEEGGRVFEVRRLSAQGRTQRAAGGPPADHTARRARAAGAAAVTDVVAITFGNHAVDFSRVHVGDRVWKTSDPALERHWRQSYAGDSPRFQRPVTMEVHGHAGAPLTLIARDEMAHVVRVDSTVALVAADKQPLLVERLRDQLGRLGGTPFKLDSLENRLEGAVLLPLSELNRLRREVVSQLEHLRAQPKRWTLKVGQASRLSSSLVDKRHSTPVAGGLSSPPPDVATEPSLRKDKRDAHPTLIVLVRNLPQLEAALRCGIRTVYCEFENPKKYRDAVTLFHTARGCESAIRNPQSTIYVAPPRIFKPGEEWQLEQVRSCNADGYLVRNYDHLRVFANDRCVGDFSLNVANHRTADYFRNGFGLERVTASYDLNTAQLEALLQGVPPDGFEVTIHQHMPMFHMEHCVFCAFLSSGRDYRDCGRPCDRHQVGLRDRVGIEHPLKADVGCRNTVFNGVAQTGAEHVPRLIELGVRWFRLEFLNETVETVERTIARYRQLLRGEISGTQVWRELKLLNQLGVTRGTAKVKP